MSMHKIGRDTGAPGRNPGPCFPTITEAEFAEFKRLRERMPQQLRAAEHIGQALGTITAFDRKCKRAEYTDVGECWDVLYEARDLLRKAARLMVQL